MTEFCKYCGKELYSHVEASGFFSKTVINDCGCKDALKIIEIKKKIIDLENSMPKEKYRLQTSYSIVERKELK